MPLRESLAGRHPGSDSCKDQGRWMEFGLTGDPIIRISILWRD